MMKKKMAMLLALFMTVTSIEESAFAVYKDKCEQKVYN